MLDSRIRRVLVALDRKTHAATADEIISPNDASPGVVGAILGIARNQGFAVCLGKKYRSGRIWQITDAGRAAIRET